MFRVRILSLVLALSFACQVVLAQQQGGQPQQPQQPQGPMIQVVQATVKSVEVKGRVKKLTLVSPEGQELTVQMTPKIQLEIVASGDEGFLRPGQLLQAKGVMTNNRLFVGEVGVVLLPKGKKPTPGRMTKAPEKVGESRSTYLISGPIVAMQQDTDYPDYKAIALKTSDRSAPIMLEKNFKVVVISDDLTSVKEGTPAEVEGLPGPGGRFNVGRISIRLEESLKADDVLGPVEEK
ncbi:MAG: hypothetical protein KDA69_01330 [Planctomycetaceae bacterium]|nr:hypothetical protein [Planctomycetaceae bacterium]MCA9042928.1 hypothetical protein [Planctomycetaceae bacterium]